MSVHRPWHSGRRSAATEDARCQTQEDKPDGSCRWQAGAGLRGTRSQRPCAGGCHKGQTARRIQRRTLVVNLLPGAWIHGIGRLAAETGTLTGSCLWGHTWERHVWPPGRTFLFFIRRQNSSPLAEGGRVRFGRLGAPNGMTPPMVSGKGWPCYDDAILTPGSQARASGLARATLLPDRPGGDPDSPSPPELGS